MSEHGTPAPGRVTVSREAAIAVLTLDRPAKLNALDMAMLTELERHLDDVDHDANIRVLILTGAGERSFCVGADIEAWSALDPLDMWRVWVRDGHRVLERLASLRQPTVAAINGFAFGGGLELALAADIRIAAETATLGLPEVTIGTLPGWAGTRRLQDTIGAPRAKQMIFSGERVDATTAERWGLVNETAPAPTLMTRARAVAEKVAGNAPVAVQLAKAVIDGEAATRAALASAIAAGTDDGREGVAAFREKRSPRFTGR
jgi:enoyl-CoA hydratase/carnithine racemase